MPDVKFNSEKIPFFVLYGNRLNAEETYIKDIHSLSPSHFAIYKNGSIEFKKYYDIPIKAQQKKENQNDLNSFKESDKGKSSPKLDREQITPSLNAVTLIQ